MIKKTLIMLLIELVFFSVSSYSSDTNTRTILVTSSTGALGSAISKDLASKGYNLILAARDEAKLKTLQKTISGKAKVNVIKFDYNNVNQLSLAAASLQDKSIDGMVIIAPRPNFSADIPKPVQWRDNFESTFIGPLEFIRLTSKKMKNPSALVIIFGESSKYYMPNYPNSNIIRLMWSGEVKNLCHQYSNKHIRVNAVSPGVILTEHNINKIKERAQLANKNFDRQLIAETGSLPSKTYGTPHDVAVVVEFLLKDDSKHINCENIVMSGGANKSY